MKYIFYFLLTTAFFSPKSQANLPKFCDEKLTPDPRTFWAADLIEDAFVSNLNDMHRFKALGFDLPNNETSFRETFLALKGILTLAIQQRTYKVVGNKAIEASKIEISSDNLQMPLKSRNAFMQILPKEEHSFFIQILKELMDELKEFEEETLAKNIPIKLIPQLISLNEPVNAKDLSEMFLLGGSIMLLVLQEEGQERYSYKIAVQRDNSVRELWTFNFVGNRLHMEKNLLDFNIHNVGIKQLTFLRQMKRPYKVKGVFAVELIN